MKHPNIVFILTDDQRYNTIHALGNKDIITPNMDWLVRNGTSFTQAHIPGGDIGSGLYAIKSHDTQWKNAVFIGKRRTEYS